MLKKRLSFLRILTPMMLSNLLLCSKFDFPALTLDFSLFLTENYDPLAGYVRLRAQSACQYDTHSVGSDTC